jgi:Transglycosylase SLT domain
MAGDPTPFLQAAKRYGSDPAFDKWARDKYGVSGSALLAKVAKGESGFDMGAVSSAGARGGTQFIPPTRAAFIKRYGVDAWKDPDSAVHATKLYLQHDSRGVAGYNPGMPSYTDYILGQKVGDLGAVKGSGGKAPGQPRTTTTSGVDNSALRAQAVQQFLGSKNSDPVSFAMAIRNAQDVPGKTTTTPGTPAQAATAGGGNFRKSHSPLLELIHKTGTGQGFAVKNGQEVSGPGVYGSVWAGHQDHVHAAAGPKTIVELGKLAQSMGLHVGENPHFGGVNPVHAKNSYHYKGEAIDVSGDPKKMNAFARKVEQLYGLRPQQ